MDIMGIEIDVAHKSLAIRDKKLGEIIKMCKEYESRTVVTKTELQSLLGKLLYVSKIIRPTGGFLKRMLQTLRNASSTNTVELEEGFQKELSWFSVFLKEFNGKTTFRNWKSKVEHQVFVDASLHGLGA